MLGLNLPKIEAFTALPILTPVDVANAEAPGAWPRPKFPKDHLGFFTDLKKRVANYFATTKISDRDSWRMYLKSGVIMTWLAVSYCLLVFGATSLWLAIPAAISLALAMATVGMSIQHDGGHGGYSKYNWVNKLSALALDLIGASSYVWQRKHGVFHHTYVNIEGQDTDIDIHPVGRFSPHQKRYWFHRFQQFYLWVLYGLLGPRWHLVSDYQNVIQGKIGKHRIARPKGWDLVLFIGGKIVSTGLLLVVPMMFHDWWVVLCFYAGVTWILGIVLSVVFQLAHCVEEAEFPATVGEPAMVEASWAVHQVQTTVDFARNNPFWTWILGGLNFQVVHHLFPRITHIHYPALSKIVEETCNDYGLKYNTHTTFTAGVISHYRWLKRMGQPPAEKVRRSKLRKRAKRRLRNFRLAARRG